MSQVARHDASIAAAVVDDKAHHETMQRWTMKKLGKLHLYETKSVNQNRKSASILKFWSNFSEAF